MSKKDYFFKKDPVRGVGDLYFLIALQDASAGSSASTLLGSPLQWGEGGILKKDFPVPEHYLAPPQIILNKLGADSVMQHSLAALVQHFDMTKTVGVDLKASAVGVPAGAGLDLDYHHVLDITVEIPAGAAVVSYIPMGNLLALYDGVHGDIKKIDPRLSKDCYIADKCLIVKKMSVSVTSNKDFGVDFNAKVAAAQASGTAQFGYKQVSNRKITFDVDGIIPYLFAISGKRWRKLG